MNVQNGKLPLPVYKTPGSAGMDLLPIETKTIPAFSTLRFKTGIRIEIPTGHRGEIHERSSIFMEGLFIRGVIDEDFRGELEIAAYNGNPYPVEIANDGKPVAQLIIQPYVKARLEEVTELSRTKRTGGFGSTNLKSITQDSTKLLFNGMIGDQKKTFYLDSGAEGNLFGDKDLAKHIELTKLDTPRSFHVADNNEVIITHIAKNVDCNIQGYKFKSDILIMPNDLDFISRIPLVAET